MHIDELKRRIIEVVSKTDNESLLNVLQEDIAEFSITPKDKTAAILGQVDWEELREQATEETTIDNSMSEAEFDKWLNKWK